jgi:hypothetical protein
VYDKSIEAHRAEKPSMLTVIATQKIPNTKREFDNFPFKFEAIVTENEIFSEAQASLWLRH